ncbi:MAG: EI24 domain-containing protein [Pseudomonadota bacterium]
MSTFKDFFIGINYIFKGFRYLIAHPRLWPWALLPTLINLALLALMLGVFIHYYGDIYGWLSAHILKINITDATAWYWHILNGLLWVVNLLFQLLIIVLSLVVLLIVSYAAGLIIAAPFNDALSERVEIMITGQEPEPFRWKKFIADLFRIIKIESIKALILIAIPVVLFVLNIIPVIGGFLYVFLTFLFGAWDLGFTYADLPMGRKIVPLKMRIAFARKYKWGLIGLGAGFIIPFFNLICVSPMVVGGTLFYVDKESSLRPRT